MQFYAQPRCERERLVVKPKPNQSFLPFKSHLCTIVCGYVEYAYVCYNSNSAPYFRHLPLLPAFLTIIQPARHIFEFQSCHQTSLCNAAFPGVFEDKPPFFTVPSFPTPPPYICINQSPLSTFSRDFLLLQYGSYLEIKEQKHIRITTAQT